MLTGEKYQPKYFSHKNELKLERELSQVLTLSSYGNKSIILDAEILNYATDQAGPAYTSGEIFLSRGSRVRGRGKKGAWGVGGQPSLSSSSDESNDCTFSVIHT